MRLTFRQGIVKHQTDIYNTPTFLDVSGGYVSLVTTNDPTVITFVQGTKDYLYTERQTQNNAWGPFTSGDQWLYWQLNMATGVREFGSTSLEPLTGTTPPLSPTTGQSWFNTMSNIMYEYNGASWVEVVRVFACKLQGSTTPVSMSINAPDFRGTQVGLNTPARAGSLIFDLQGKPIKTSDRRFFTTEDEIFTGVSTGARLKVGNILIPGIAQQPLHKYQVVEFSDFNEILPATPFTQLTRVYGIIEEDAPVGDVVDFVTEGMIYNEDWDWVALGADVNDPVYIDNTGGIQVVPFIGGQLPVGVVVGTKEIMFSPRLFSQVEASVNFDITASFMGTLPTIGQFIYNLPITRETQIIDSGTVEHQGYAGTAPSGGSAVFALSSSVNGGTKVSRGTFEFADGSNVITSQSIDAFYMQPGEVLHIQCLASNYIKDISLTLMGQTLVFWKP